MGLSYYAGFLVYSLQELGIVCGCVFLAGILEELPDVLCMCLSVLGYTLMLWRNYRSQTQPLKQR